MSEDKIEVIQVRIKEHTLAQIDKLAAITKAASRSDAVRKSLDITDMVIDAIIKGEKILFENKKGKQQQLLIVGLNK